MNQVFWSETTKSIFIRESGLLWRSEMGSQVAREYIMVLKKHIADKTNEEIANEMNFTNSKVDDIIRDLKEMYDDVVYQTGLLIPRENLTKKDFEIQINRYGYQLTTENLRKYKVN